MKTFAKFFSGTMGVVLAVVLCVGLACLACAVSAIAVPIVFPITPTP